MLLATSNLEEFLTSTNVNLSYVVAILAVVIGFFVVRFLPRVWRALLYFFVMMGAVLLLHYQIVPTWVGIALLLIGGAAPVAIENNIDYLPELLRRLEEVEKDESSQ